MPSFDWSAVFAGSLVGAGVAISSLMLGAALMAAYLLSENSSSLVLTVGSAIFICCAMLFASAVGSYFAGRHRRSTADWTIKARVMLDGAHGVLVWALVWCVGAAIAGAA